MKTEILKIKGNWQEVVDDCRATVKKSPLGKEPSKAFKKAILISEHSPIRDISVKFSWKNIKYWVAMHWKTHHWESKVSTQRTDRTGVDRNKLPQDAPVDFVGEANVQHLIDTMRKRLCYQASPETREYAEDLKQAITEVQPEIGYVLCPSCVYRAACPEMQSCGFWDKLSKHMTKEQICDWKQRYTTYNLDFMIRMEEKELREADADV